MRIVFPFSLILLFAFLGTPSKYAYVLWIFCINEAYGGLKDVFVLVFRFRAGLPSKTGQKSLPRKWFVRSLSKFQHHLVLHFMTLSKTLYPPPPPPPLHSKPTRSARFSAKVARIDFAIGSDEHDVAAREEGSDRNADTESK